MYHFPGEYVTDFCIVHHQGVYHLFHIRGERWTWPVGYRELDLGHATSTDLRTWTPQEPVLPAGPVGAWDEMGNWAPDIIEKNGVFYCYYTGSDKNNNQAIGLATSVDLFTWEKHPNNPVVVPGSWSDQHVGRDVAGRDAMVYHDRVRNRYLLYYTATMADGRACIALAQSTDLIHWEDRGPTYIEEDRSFNRLESAYLVPQDGKYYLFYSAKGGPKSKGFAPAAFDHFDIVYQVSADPTRGWLKPDDHVLLAQQTCASEHPTFDNVTYMFYIIQEEIEGVWGASVLSDPKRMAWQPDGSVRICEHEPENVQEKLLFDSEATEYTGWIQHGSEWRETNDGERVTVSSSSDTFLMDTLWGKDLAFEAEIQAEADGVASLVVRGNPSGMAGYRISLDFGRKLVGFYLRVPGQADRVIQERPVSIQPGAWHKLKVTVQWKFFEVYVDEHLLLVHDQRVYEDGCFGLHARGTAQFRKVLAYTITTPRWALPEWSNRCRPRHLFP